ncbi:RNA polymerase sigma factor [Pedobacter rhizosphaerae]|uniref:RNA polymerase sigma-70 factor, ECF subfamily n=1 Tax=Pedobacter rhizosphaerae TaxID=390241 RepID=A0A1H9N3W4_9SPHI|nr:RNA polymerase sigma-70 factor [Pedobacter rhizosphaerae]SER30521.1 RNA polymerase sigma-70 factor, ECF subfamily [Pedobacter rhizosphaerae]
MRQYKLYQDRELVELMRNGDEQVMMEIYDRYWKRMLAVAYKRLDNQQDAEECVQDVLYNLWKLRENFGLEKLALSNYLSRAIRNQSFNILEKRYRIRLKAEGYKQEAVNYLSPERALILKELQAKIDNAISELPPQCQLVFRLSRQEGLSAKEIAEKLNLSENTVKSHLKKANRDIQGNLDLITALILSYLFFQK